MNSFSLSKILIITVLAVLLLLFFFNFQVFVSLPSEIFHSVTLAPVKIISIISNKTTNVFGLFFNIKYLKGENERLYFENKKLRVDNVKLRELEIENSYLGKALGIEEVMQYDLIPARIIGKDPAASSSHVIVDKGTYQGVEENMIAISSNGALLGQIKKVNSRHSQLLPITTSNSSINVITQESRAEGILRGEYGLSLVLEFVLQNEEIRVDEAIITSGINDQFPRGILVGYVVDVYSEPNQPFQRAKIRAESEIDETEWVYIIKSY